MQRRLTPKAVSSELIERKILVIRSHKVMLDADLAALYGVTTKRLNEQVKRNRARFPEDFMFQLTVGEATQLQELLGVSDLRSQFATSKERGGRRYLPYVFTEQGVAVLSSVLRSERAIQVNMTIMRTFVQLRKMIVSYGEWWGTSDPLPQGGLTSRQDARPRREV